MLNARQQFGHYKIRSAIGAGGMGEVYLADDSRLHRKVALKLLTKDIAEDEERLLRFEQEARAASALNHPNILTIHEFGVENGVHFLATEFIEGETLREKINSGELSLTDALNIAEQTASALSAAHAAGIVHRDIKPENIMIRRDGITKVLDFGLAKLIENKEISLDAETKAGTLLRTNPGVVMGTVPYMSPEQATAKDMDARTDIWSVGVVLYEMVSGKLPFAGETMYEMIVSILKTEPPLLSHYISDVPNDLERIVGKSLRKNRDERYQTVKDLQIDLKDLRQELEFEAKFERSSSLNKRLNTLDKNRQAQFTDANEAAISTKDEIEYPSSSAEHIASEIKQRKRGFTVGLAILLLAAIGLGYWFFANRSTNATQIKSIAILPFENESGNADVEYLSDGMTESLIGSLSQLPNLKVKARTSVFRYKGKEIDPKRIGQELSVQAILIGRVLQRGQDLTLYIELIDAATENVLWKDNYSRSMSNLVSLQSDIAKDVSHKLKTKLSRADEQQVTKTYTENTEAYQLYLKGRYHLNKQNEDGYKKSLDYFQQAIALDPNYALAYAGIADAYFLAADFYLSNREAMEKAKAAATRALEIDDTLAEAHSSMGTVRMIYDWNWSETEKELKRAIELNPNYADAHMAYSFYLGVVRGRHSEAIEQAKQALQLDPYSLLANGTLASALMRGRQYDQAIEQFHKTLELDQNFWWAHQWLGETYARKGQFLEAIAELQKARQLDNNPQIWGRLGRAHALSGNRIEAQNLINELKELSKQHYVSSTYVAEIYTGLGERDKAFEWLEKAYEERSGEILFLQSDPLWDNLRTDSRFQDLLRRVDFPQ